GFAAATDLGLFASLKWRFGEKLTLQGGARLTENSRFGTALTPSLWLAYRPNNWELKASYANGFRSPGLKELYFQFIDINHNIVDNTDLKPETSHNLKLEIGRNKWLKYNWTNGYSLNGFLNSVKDCIVLAEYEALKFNYQDLADWRTMGGGFT